MRRHTRSRLGSIFVVSVLTAAGVLASPALAQDPPPTTTDSAADAPLSLLAILDAAGGTYAKGKLTLTDVESRAQWFSDRPNREVGTYSIPKLIEVFFADPSPPNAALEFAGAAKRNDVAVVELSRPHYDKRAQRVSFTAEILQDPQTELGHGSALDGHADRHDGRIPKAFDAVTLFVDSAEPCTATVYEVEVVVDSVRQTSPTEEDRPCSSASFYLEQLLSLQDLGQGQVACAGLDMFPVESTCEVTDGGFVETVNFYVNADRNERQTFEVHAHL